MKLGSNALGWLYRAAIVLLAWVQAGCASVGFDHGSTVLHDKALVFGRIVLDRGDGFEPISTLSTPVVIRNIESAAEPGLVTQPMDKDGRFYWTIPPGWFQVSLVLNRFPDGYRSYAFHVPKAGAAYYFGDLVLRGDKRFDTIGGANIRNVQPEIRDAFQEAQAHLKQLNPQVADASMSKLALTDMTRPDERARAYRDAVDAQRVCCRSFAELPYEKLPASDRKSYSIGPSSPVFEFASGRSRLLAFELPAIPPPYAVVLRSTVTPSNLAAAGRANIFAPAVMLLDENFRPLAGPETESFNIVPASLMPPRAASMQAFLQIDGSTAGAKYVVLYTTPAILSGQMRTWRPGFVGVPGGALPTGTPVSLILEPAISGDLEVSVVPR